MIFLHFITSAQVEKQLPGLSTYDTYDLVSQGKRVVPLVSDAVKTIKKKKFVFNPAKIKKIYCAPSGQTLATAHLLAKYLTGRNTKVIPTPLLYGIRFSMKSLISKETLKKQGYNKAMQTARKNFVEGFFNSQLIESREQAIERMMSLKKLLFKQKEEVLVIGHGFFLKLFQIYLESPRSLSNSFSLLKKFTPARKPYEPLEGFDYIL